MSCIITLKNPALMWFPDRLWFFLLNYFVGPENHYADRFLGFSLYVSNTTDKLEGTLCYKDTEFNRTTIPAVFNTTCPLHGQYVIYYNERLDGVTYPQEYSKYAYNEICELEVFGEYFLNNTLL